MTSRSLEDILFVYVTVYGVFAFDEDFTMYATHQFDLNSQFFISVHMHEEFPVSARMATTRMFPFTLQLVRRQLAWEFPVLALAVTTHALFSTLHVSRVQSAVTSPVLAPHSIRWSLSSNKWYTL